MEELIGIVLEQPLGLAIGGLWLVLLMMEKIVPGKTHQRALDTIAEQQRTIDDLRATAKANLEANRLALDFMQGFDERLRKEDEGQ